MGRKARRMGYDDYGISKERYRQLVAFCATYEEKKRQLSYGVKAVSMEGMPHGTDVSSPTEAAAVANLILRHDTDIIERCARLANREIWKDILRSATTGRSYTRLGYVPIGEKDFYAYRRLFFHYLDVALRMEKV